MPHSPNACRVGRVQLGIDIQEATTKETVEGRLVGSLVTNVPLGDHKAVTCNRLLQQEVVQEQVVIQVLVSNIWRTRVHRFQDLYQRSEVGLYRTSNKTNVHNTQITQVIKISTVFV